jgi:site-specific DNA-methyltransferase (cytosine-N4-specific)
LVGRLNLSYVATRLNGTAAGGAEADVIFEAGRLIFSRWQVHCKNTQCVSLDDAAKAIGLTYLFHSNVVVIVSTGKIGTEARNYANKVMKDSNLCVVMIDRTDILEVEKIPMQIVEVFNREAKHAMKLKALEL